MRISDWSSDVCSSDLLDGIVSGDRDLLRDGFRALDRDDAMRGVPRTQLDRSDLLASGAVVRAANLVALAEALFDLNARDPRDRHLVRGLVELGLETEAAQDGWRDPVPLEIER